MGKVTLLKERWEKSSLPIVFYHTTFVEHVPSILKERKIIANKGESICKAKNGLVSLSDRLTKGIIEFFGNVVFKFYAVSLYRKNRLIVPKSYGSNIKKLYEEVPLFENEWTVPKKLKFDLDDIYEVFLITNKFFRESAFREVVKTLKSNGTKCLFLSERWLPDKEVTDMTSYLLRIRRWKKFSKERLSA